MANRWNISQINWNVKKRISLHIFIHVSLSMIFGCIEYFRAFACHWVWDVSFVIALPEGQDPFSTICFSSHALNIWKPFSENHCYNITHITLHHCISLLSTLCRILYGCIMIQPHFETKTSLIKMAAWLVSPLEPYQWPFISSKLTIKSLAQTLKV